MKAVVHGKLSRMILLTLVFVLSGFTETNGFASSNSNSRTLKAPSQEIKPSNVPELKTGAPIERELVGGQRARFAAAYPTTMSPAEFVDQLFANVGVMPSDADRTVAVGEFSSAGNTADTAARARALRRVAENASLAQKDFESAFVLMQYFGYLRRDPNTGPDTNFDGYNFWLTKLDTFNGNFQQAEMVKAFLTSIEYRARFPR